MTNLYLRWYHVGSLKTLEGYSGLYLKRGDLVFVREGLYDHFGLVICCGANRWYEILSASSDYEL